MFFPLPFRKRTGRQKFTGGWGGLMCQLSRVSLWSQASGWSLQKVSKISCQSPAKMRGVPKLANVSSQKQELSDKYLFELAEECQENDNPQIYPDLSLSHICSPTYTKITFMEAEPEQMQSIKVFWGHHEVLMKPDLRFEGTGLGCVKNFKR